MTDYYALLKVSRTANAAEIKQAYRRMAVLLHPDKNPHPEAAEGFRAVSEAWEVLGDPFKKAMYDQMLTSEPEPVHRDPAYRRQYRSRPVSKPDPDFILKKRFYSYSKWVIWTALLFSALLTLDYFLPEVELKDEVVRDQRTIHHHTMHTLSGRKFDVMFPQNKAFHKEPEIFIRVSPVLGLLKGIETTSGNFKLHNLPSTYLNFGFAPIIMAGLALVSVLFFRSEGEEQFNAAVVLIFLILLNLIFFVWSKW